MPAASERSSADTGEAGPPIGSNACPAPATRKTPAVVTRTGREKGAEKRAIAAPAGGFAGANQRSPRSREKRRPEEEETGRVIGVRDEVRDAAFRQADRSVAQSRSPIVGDEHAFSLRADVEPSGRSIHFERRDDQALPRNTAPRLAAVQRTVEAADGGGIDHAGALRVPTHGVGAAVCESVLESCPVVSAVLRAVDPAASRDPDVARVGAGEVPGVNGRVQHHSLGNPGPRDSAVPRAEGLAPGAGIEDSGIGWIEG